MRTLNRPMFRMGGSAGSGITSGLAPRQGYANPAGMVEQIQNQKSVIDALAPRTPRPQPSMAKGLMEWGLNMASATPSGSVLNTAAEAAKGPLANYQQAKQLETAYGQKETSEDRALIASMIKGMDDDKLSAMMKKVKAGVASGYYKDEKSGIIRQLQKEEYGVMDMPGEAKDDRIKDLEGMLSKDEEVPTGMLKAVAEHIWNIENDTYPKHVQEDLSRTRTFIKPNHITAKKKDNEGEVTELIIDSIYNRTYTIGKIYFEAETGDLFQRVGKEGEAIRFVKVIYEN